MKRWLRRAWRRTLANMGMAPRVGTRTHFRPVNGPTTPCCGAHPATLPGDHFTADAALVTCHSDVTVPAWHAPPTYVEPEVPAP